MDLKFVGDEFSKCSWDPKSAIAWNRCNTNIVDIYANTESLLEEFQPFSKLKHLEKVEFRRHYSSAQISELAFAEYCEAKTLTELLKKMDDPVLNILASIHCFDEAKHTYCLNRYLELTNLPKPKLAEMDPSFNAMVRGDLNLAATVVCSQLLGENVAFCSFSSLSRFTSDPLLAEIAKLLLVDESRHLTYVQLYLEMAESDLKNDVWLADIVETWCNTFNKRFVLYEFTRDFQIDPTAFAEFLENRPSHGIFKKAYMKRVSDHLERLSLKSSRLQKYFDYHCNP